MLLTVYVDVPTLPEIYAYVLRSKPGKLFINRFAEEENNIIYYAEPGFFPAFSLQFLSLRVLHSLHGSLSRAGAASL